MGNTTNTTTEGPRRYKRRQYIVSPAFQWKYTISIALIVFTISSVLTLALYGVLHHQARLRSMNPETYTADVALVVVVSAIAFSVLTAGGIGFWCVIITHRICGPLVVMAKYLDELKSGRFPKVRPLRQKDEFKDFYNTLSGMIGSLKATKQQQFEALTKSLSIAKSAQSADDDVRRTALSSIAKQLEALRKQVAQDLQVDCKPLPTAAGKTREPSAVAAASG